jgi:peptidoglycan hydrolase-like protein with peptidoglycan-binding domain
MRPEAERVKEIQKALIEAGDLRQEPTGMWDDATREAMKQYQQGHGFAPTGLPDSKSLMKMGLGPHPLPPDVATAAATSARLDPTVAPAPLSGPSDGRPAATVDPPQ